MGMHRGNSELTAEEVLHIRHQLDNKLCSATEIGRARGMSAEAIRRIGRRETWAWLPEAPVAPQIDASLARLQALVAAGESAPVQAQIPKLPDRFAGEANALEKLEADIARKRALSGDALVSELTGRDGTGNAN